MSRARVAMIALALLGGCESTTPPGDSGAPDAAPDAGPACTLEIAPEAELPEPARHTPRWAFEPWISKDISDRDDTLAFVAGFRERDIPVGAVVIDSPWDVQYTTFTPNPSRYPDFGEMVAMLHAIDVRVVMWTTAMVNRSSFDAEVGGDIYRGPAPNLADGLACDFFVNDGELYDWWKGRGASVDFFDARARAWWHAQQDALLDMGIDGWKLDFGDSYLEADTVLATDAGDVPHQQYSETYYRDFLAYGVSRRGRDFTTMVRAWDESYDRIGRFHARREHAPVVWIGDNHRDWTGIVDVLDGMFRSASAGYVVIGSDVGGYLDRDQNMLTRTIPFDLENFHRWVALGAMTPFMQLHGRGNLAPWTVPGTSAEQDETVANYRYWATLHHAMVPFWYSLAEAAYASDGVVVHPIGTQPEWAGDWRYVLGEAFLVAPILEAGGAREVALPDGARWYDWWDPAADPIAGGTTISFDAGGLLRIPLYVREGAIVPMHVENDANALGSAASADYLTVLAWPATEPHSFSLYDDAGAVETVITANGDASGAAIAFAPARDHVIVRMRMDTAPSSVIADRVSMTEHADRAAFDAAEAGFLYDASTRSLWIKSTAPVASIASP